MAAADVSATVSGLCATETFTFNTNAWGAGTLPTGNYEAILRAGGAKNSLNEGLAADHATPFFVLAGDADHDRDVDANDYFYIDSNIVNPDARGFIHGDFNYSGGPIDGDDYHVIDSLAPTFGAFAVTNLPGPGELSVTAATSTDSTSPGTIIPTTRAASCSSTAPPAKPTGPISTSAPTAPSTPSPACSPTPATMSRSPPSTARIPPPSQRSPP